MPLIVCSTPNNGTVRFCIKYWKYIAVLTCIPTKYKPETCIKLLGNASIILYIRQWSQIMKCQNVMRNWNKSRSCSLHDQCQRLCRISANAKSTWWEVLMILYHRDRSLELVKDEIATNVFDFMPYQTLLALEHFWYKCLAAYLDLHETNVMNFSLSCVYVLYPGVLFQKSGT